MIFLLPAALLLPACAAAAPALTAVSAGAAAGEKGFSFLNSGRLHFVEDGPLEPTADAVRATIDRLDLMVRYENEETHDDGTVHEREWSVRSDHSHLVIIVLDHLTDSMTSVQVKAGPFGNKPAAQLIASTIKEELILQAKRQNPQSP